MTHGRARNLTIALMVWAGCAHAEPVAEPGAAPGSEPEIPSLDDLANTVPENHTLPPSVRSC